MPIDRHRLKQDTVNILEAATERKKDIPFLVLSLYKDLVGEKYRDWTVAIVQTAKEN
jgi:hypothetical protein